MKLGNYSSVHVNSVDQKEIDSQLRGDTLIMGLDVAKRVEYAALGDETGEKFGVVRWNHPKETIKFADLVDKLNYSQVQMVVEPTGTYADPLRYLAYGRGWEVWRMGSKRVSDAKEIADGVPSIHDPKAAHLLLWLHDQGLANQWPPEEKSRRRVKTLTQQLAHLQGEWQRHLGYLEAEMARYWPEIIQAWELKRATLLGILKNFGDPRKLVENETEVRAYMKKKGGPQLSKERIDEVMEAAQDSLGVAPLRSELESLKNLARRADRLRGEIKELKRTIKGSIKQEEILRLADEVGTPTSALFWEKIGPFQSYNSADELIKAFGLNLKEDSSGKRNGSLHITKRGPGEARSALYLATWRKINADPLFQAWHRGKLKRDGGEETANKNVSVVALMRKYLKGLWHVVRGEEFDSTLLFDVDKLKSESTSAVVSTI